MTYLDAAFAILKQADDAPLHYQEITQRALAAGLIKPAGATPDATMGSRLYTDTKEEGSRFVRAGRGYFELARRQPSGIDAQVQRINQETRERLHELLLAMPPVRFEALITELLLQMGFDESTVRQTSYSNDGGIDVVGTLRAAGLTEVNAAVQVKRWKRNVPAPTVTQLRGSLQVHQQGIIITTSGFSKGAIDEAAASGKSRISLIDGDQLLDLLIKHKVGVSEKQLTVTALDDEWWGELLGNGSQPTLHTSQGVTPPPTGAAPAPSGAPTLQRAPSTKPTTFTLHGQTQPVASWKKLLVGVCALLARRHGADFLPRASLVSGKKRTYFALSPDGMHTPAPVPGTDLWVETHFSGPSILRLIDSLLVGLGEAPESLSISYS